MPLPLVLGQEQVSVFFVIRTFRVRVIGRRGGGADRVPVYVNVTSVMSSSQRHTTQVYEDRALISLSTSTNALLVSDCAVS